MAYIHLVEPRVEGNEDREPSEGEERSTTAVGTVATANKPAAVQ